MAASQNEQNASDGETYIEKYIRGLSAVESILTLDRLRQVSIFILSSTDMYQISTIHTDSYFNIIFYITANLNLVTNVSLFTEALLCLAVVFIPCVIKDEKII